jgi:hypothetical protein
MTLAAGTELGSYEVLSRIGAGGMGVVYEAEDGSLHEANSRQGQPFPLACGSTDVNLYLTGTYRDLLVVQFESYEFSGSYFI